MNADRARRFSRWMPPRQTPPLTPGQKLLMVAAAPVWMTVLALTLPIAGVASVFMDRRMARLRDERPGEGICTFARSFGRDVDPWIIRAVHQELLLYADLPGGPLPIRATDRLYDVLHIDGEELEDIARDVAQRTGRALDGAERNPLYGRVETVGDLVRFFAYQPRTRAGSA